VTSETRRTITATAHNFTCHDPHREMYDKHRDTALVHNAVADATEHDRGDITAAARADNDEVVTAGFRLVKDGFGWRAVMLRVLAERPFGRSAPFRRATFHTSIS
jgi:hypothetical protein